MSAIPSVQYIYASIRAQMALGDVGRDARGRTECTEFKRHDGMTDAYARALEPFGVDFGQWSVDLRIRGHEGTARRDWSFAYKGKRLPYIDNHKKFSHVLHLFIKDGRLPSTDVLRMLKRSADVPEASEAGPPVDLCGAEGAGGDETEEANAKRRDAEPGRRDGAIEAEPGRRDETAETAAEANATRRDEAEKAKWREELAKFIGKGSFGAVTATYTYRSLEDLFEGQRPVKRRVVIEDP